MNLRELLVRDGWEVQEASIVELDDSLEIAFKYSDYTVNTVGLKVYEYLDEPDTTWEEFEEKFSETLQSEMRASLGDANAMDSTPSHLESAGISWKPVDLSDILAGGLEMPTPTILRRSDGFGLLYAGEVHNFVGESGVGKGWIALHAAAQVIRDGGKVVYIDFEDGPVSIAARLRALGVNESDVRARFFYVRPEMPVNLGDAALELARTLDNAQPDLVVIDGVTGAMQLHDLEPNSNSDAAKFLMMFPRRIADHTCAPAVVLIDHPTKARNGQRAYAIGAQHKRAGIAVTYIVEAKRPIEKGRDDGLVQILVSKDRHGTVQAAAVGSRMPKSIADLHVAANVDGSEVTISLEPAGSSMSASTRNLKNAIQGFLAKNPGASQNNIIRGVKGHSSTIKSALQELVNDGSVRFKQKGQTRAHHLVSVPDSSDEP
jgi:KaiC/GvpD/RAD55 family RecA-like ATPase